MHTHAVMHAKCVLIEEGRAQATTAATKSESRTRKAVAGKAGEGNQSMGFSRSRSFGVVCLKSPWEVHGLVVTRSTASNVVGQVLDGHRLVADVAGVKNSLDLVGKMAQVRVYNTGCCGL